MEHAGVRVLLFTDIEGSTALLQRLGPRYVDLLTAHDRVIRTVAARHEGAVVDAEGDGYFLIFGTANSGLAAALDMQLDLARQPWPEQEEVRVRMGLHVGDVLETRVGLVGLAIHHAARIAAAAHGGQVLVSDSAASLVERVPDGVALRSIGAHELRDVGETTLFQLVHPSLRDQFPPPRVIGRPRHNLPAPHTSMIGRDAETTAVAALLGTHSLVTLVGAGGCGKTRLAIRIASEVDRTFPDGVRLVELAALSDPAGVPAAVLAAFGATAEATTTREVVELLRDREVLLVLDNCEHLLEACAGLIGEVLSACARVTVLTTSREPIGVTGELVYRVPSLPVAPPSASIDELRATDSARLFEERVALVRPGFTIGPDDAVAVAEICRRLDGIPMAIELAAARCRLLTPADLASRLDDRFRILTGGARNALPRQQTLLAMIDWSYRLLNEPEQVLLARLAVFHAGASLEAIEAVCAGDPIDPLDVVELVGSLVDKSLLNLDDSLPISVRVRLPETIRQFATDRLLDRSELPALRDRHAAWFGSLAVPLAIGPWQRSRTERGELARADQENLHRALDWATATASTDALRIITILSTLHPEIRPPDQLGARIRAALDATPDAPPSLRAIALARLAWDVIEAFGDESLAHATDLSEQALALARGTGDPRTLAEVAMWGGFVQDSTPIGLEGVAAADATGDATFATYLRLEAVRFCDYDTCETLLREAQRLVELHRIDEYGATIALNIAETAARRGDAAAALVAIDRALEADDAAPFNHRLETRVHGAIILADEGHFEDAEALLADGLSLLSSTQTDLSMEREARGARAHLARVRGDLKSARLAATASLGAERPYLFRTDGLALLALSAADRDDGRIAEAVGSLLPVVEWLGARGAETRAQAMEELAACLVDIDGTEEAARVLVTADQLRSTERVPLAPARVPTVEALRVEIGPTELARAEPMPDEEVLDLARALAQPGE